MRISREDKVENYIIRTGYTIAQLLSILDSLAFPFLTFYLTLFVVGNLSFENVLSMQSKLELVSQMFQLFKVPNSFCIDKTFVLIASLAKNLFFIFLLSKINLRRSKNKFILKFHNDVFVN